jgi:hypothetical protein
MRPQRGRLLQNSCNHDRLEYNRLNLSFFTLPELAPGGVLIYRVSVRPSVLFTGEALSCDRLLTGNNSGEHFTAIWLLFTFATDCGLLFWYTAV